MNLEFQEDINGEWEYVMIGEKKSNDEEENEDDDDDQLEQLLGQGAGASPRRV